MHSFQPFINSVLDILATHRLNSHGSFARWLPSKTDPSRFELNPYGCADAANVLYTINHFPQDESERQDWIRVLRKLQDPATGFFHEETHHEFHTTAHCIAALELFDAKPLHPLKELNHLREMTTMLNYLENLKWRENPWMESHKGAGLYAALVLAGEVTPEWENAYFNWLFNETDPLTGFLRKGCMGDVPHPKGLSFFPHLASTFHYLFNIEYARRPLNHPARMVDSCLELYHQKKFALGESVSFAEIDWVYCLTRSFKQCGHRFGDCQNALRELTGSFIPYLLSLNPRTDEGLNDLHTLFGALCCVAELQACLPGTIATDRPLRLVLDRRPFI